MRTRRALRREVNRLSDEKTLERQVLESKLLPELQTIAASVGVESARGKRKSDLIGAILEKAGNGASKPAEAPATATPPAPVEAPSAPAPPVDAQPQQPAPQMQARPQFAPSSDVNQRTSRRDPLNRGRRL